MAVLKEPQAQVALTEGDIIVNLDAGGGTVDITCHKVMLLVLRRCCSACLPMLDQEHLIQHLLCLAWVHTVIVLRAVSECLQYIR